MQNPHPYYLKLDLSTKRNVYAVGDIHGRFDLVRKELDKISFDSEQDYLISVGDLVDRGPYSDEAKLWVEKPWFQHIIGNHEVLTYNAANEDPGLHLLNGGLWFNSYSPSDKLAFAEKLMHAPYVLEILSPKENKIGFLHGDIPFDDWDQLVDILDNEEGIECPDHILDFIVWGRESCQVFRNIKYSKHIKNIDHVFFGHTPMKTIKTNNNMTWIDTGAFATNNLSVVNVDDFVRKLEV